MLAWFLGGFKQTPTKIVLAYKESGSGSQQINIYRSWHRMRHLPPLLTWIDRKDCRKLGVFVGKHELAQVGGGCAVVMFTPKQRCRPSKILQDGPRADRYCESSGSFIVGLSLTSHHVRCYFVCYHNCFNMYIYVYIILFTVYIYICKYTCIYTANSWGLPGTQRRNDNRIIIIIIIISKSN